MLVPHRIKVREATYMTSDVFLWASVSPSTVHVKGLKRRRSETVTFVLEVGASPSPYISVIQLDCHISAGPDAPRGLGSHARGMGRW